MGQEKASSSGFPFRNYIFPDRRQHSGFQYPPIIRTAREGAFEFIPEAHVAATAALVDAQIPAVPHQPK
jgi:hypothetical protein